MGKKFASYDAAGAITAFYDSIDSPPPEGAQVIAIAYAEWMAAISTPGYAVQDGILVAPPAPDPRAIAIAACWEQIRGERDRRSQTGGFECAGKWYHSDAISKTQHLGNKDTARDQLDAGGAAADPLLDPVSGQQIVWKTMDGTFVPLTVQLALDIVRAGKGAEFATFQAAETHRQAMLASADPAAYDYTGGWPPVYQPAA